MELKCVETYNDIRFVLEAGESTSKITYLTDMEKRAMLNDYPEKFVVEGGSSKEKDEELSVETKVPELSNKKVKLTKK